MPRGLRTALSTLLRPWCATARWVSRRDSPMSPQGRAHAGLLAVQLAFRQTVHEYGVDLSWTPMILSKEFNRSQIARDSGMPPLRAVLTGTSISQPRLHNHPECEPHNRPVRRQRPAGALPSCVPCLALREWRGSQLRMPAVVGLRSEPRRRADGQARARAGHGGRDEGDTGEGWMGA